MKIVHISDPHGQHDKLDLPESDVLICSGDVGGRTNIHELNKFLIWFQVQPARKRIFVAGNHDIVLDKKWPQNLKSQGKTVEALLAGQAYSDAVKLIEAYDIKYLMDTEYVFEGFKFYGSPYTPSFHRQYWAFNADRGQEIQKIWGKIPSDVDILITHGPAFGVLDMVDLAGRTAWHIDGHVGCQDLMEVIKMRLHKLKLHCSGHIHDNVGVVLQSVSNKRRVMFSNGAVLTNDYTQLITKPLIINL